jgi:hypothetical protein
MPGLDPRKQRMLKRKIGPTTFVVGKDGKRKDIESMTREERKEFNKKKMESAPPQPEGTPMMAKGGRAMYKSGMRVCKLAKKGKGRAYGKNS